MKVLAVFNSKGGSGKSTLSMHLAVAAAEHMRVAILDLDAEGAETSSVWSKARDAVAPHVEASNAARLVADIGRMQKAGADLIVLDCPPSITAESAFFVSHADFVVVPVQPKMPDVAACYKAIRIVRSQNKPFAYVLNRCPPPPSIEVEQAMEGLSESGELCPVLIGDRIAFSRALASGNAVTEFQSGKAGDEARAACDWILNKLGVNHAS
jgi:chromosome partitioning protein